MKKGTEFGLTGITDGSSEDAPLHEPLLKNKNANIKADIAAVNAGLSLGLTMAESLDMFAGDGAFRELASQGFAVSAGSRS